MDVVMNVFFPSVSCSCIENNYLSICVISCSKDRIYAIHNLIIILLQNPGFITSGLEEVKVLGLYPLKFEYLTHFTLEYFSMKHLLTNPRGTLSIISSRCQDARLARPFL